MRSLELDTDFLRFFFATLAGIAQEGGHVLGSKPEMPNSCTSVVWARARAGPRHANPDCVAGRAGCRVMELQETQLMRH